MHGTGAHGRVSPTPDPAGGDGGIRTLEALSDLPVFKTTVSPPGDPSCAHVREPSRVSNSPRARQFVPFQVSVQLERNSRDDLRPSVGCVAMQVDSDGPLLATAVTREDVAVTYGNGTTVC